jgi:hypothetical protein
MNSGHDRFPIPVAFALLTVPDDNQRRLKHYPLSFISVTNNIRQFSAPVDDLLGAIPFCSLPPRQFTKGDSSISSTMDFCRSTSNLADAYGLRFASRVLLYMLLLVMTSRMSIQVFLLLLLHPSLHW